MGACALLVSRWRVCSIKNVYPFQHAIVLNVYLLTLQLRQKMTRSKKCIHIFHIYLVFKHSTVVHNYNELYHVALITVWSQGSSPHLVLSDSCLKDVLQRGNTHPKFEFDLNIPREPIWVAAQPSLSDGFRLNLFSLSCRTWALQEIMRIINGSPCLQKDWEILSSTVSSARKHILMKSEKQKWINLQ